MSWALSVPPQTCAGLTCTCGLAVCCSSALVAGMSRFSDGNADQSSATTPTTCGPAIDVPLKYSESMSLEWPDGRTSTPGAEMFVFRRCEPSEGNSSDMDYEYFSGTSM